MKTSELLRAARDNILTKDTWWQGNMFSPSGVQMCALGALQRAAGRSGEAWGTNLFEAWTKLARVATRLHGQNKGIIFLNDSFSYEPDQCFAAVHHVYEIAIKEAEEEEAASG